MRSVSGTLGIALVTALALGGCGGAKDKQPELMHLRSSTSGPDEFGILPTKPLAMPDSLTELPAPTPGGREHHRSDAAGRCGGGAGGGDPARVTGTGRAAGDGGLLGHSGRFGTEAGIRDRLAAEDLEWRRKHDGRLLERLFNINVYLKAYAPMSLDQQAELERWRKQGLRTPAAPPSGTAQEALP
ncbi:DUF3035 domain-containing protein [Rhodobacter capsulatus]|uniref:DUF3035 domain-containing protein n=1 Tax=Rhodobacter capsulatus TaxID=1061 RepID=UPI004028F892